MALIKCPECGKEISGKAKTCIYCGNSFVDETPVEIERQQCPECGAELVGDADVCPNCGFPIGKAEQPISVQQVEVTGVKVKKQTKKIALVSIVAIALCVIGVFVVKSIQKANAEQAYQTAYANYVSNIDAARVEMLSGGASAEALCNLTLQVWANSIWEKSDSATNKYVRPNGYYVSDFNDALENLFADSSTKSTVSSIRASQDMVKLIMKNLQDAPQGLERCYDSITTLYTEYRSFTELAISPTGSYSSYSDSVSEADSNFMSAYDALDTVMPELPSAS